MWNLAYSNIAEVISTSPSDCKAQGRASVIIPLGVIAETRSKTVMMIRAQFQSSAGIVFLLK